MRRIFLCSVIMTFCLATPAFSQFVVSDPALMEKPRDFDPFGQTGLSPLATI